MGTMTQRLKSTKVNYAINSLKSGDFDRFIKALNSGADVNQRIDMYSVFELACIIPERKQFIQECIKRGALVTEKNPETNEYPIHLAALSFDSDNLSQLLLDKDKRIFVDQKFEDRTALYLLFEQIDIHNWKEVFECIKLLLKYHANINATDEDSVSPIALLVTRGNDAWRKEVLDYCLQNYSVNVDFRRKQARKAIEKHFPGTPIPDIDMEKVTVEILRNKLAAGTEDDFLAAYEKFISQTEGHVLREEDCVELLSVAVYRAKLTAAQKLIEGQIVDGKFVGKPALLSGLLAKCCNRGNVPMLEWLLKIIPADQAALINEEPLLSLLVKQIDMHKDKIPFFICMDVLLNDSRIEVNKVDGKNCTALHYAVKYKIDHAQELLLDADAYIGGKDLFGNSPTSEMHSLLLEKHLDSFVTGDDRKLGDDDYEVTIDYCNFLPPKQTDKEQKNYDDDEMQTILNIAQTTSKKRLLWHPVISSILLLKWIQLTRLYCLNLFFTFIFTVSLSLYVVFFFGEDDTPFKLSCYYLSILGWMYLTARELIQILLIKFEYIKSQENWMEVVLIFVSGAVLFGLWSHPTVLVIIILSLGLELTLQVGMLPVDFISTYMAMLKTVSKNFFKCLAICSMLLVSFAFSFYTVFRIVHSNGLNKAKENMTMNITADDGAQFHQFQELPLALIKTIVMLTGEFDAASIQYQMSWTIYLLFPLFVFFVAIVMNNLMNGVAVSDATTIQAESESNGITKMVFVICRYENAMKVLNAHQIISKKLSWLIPSKSLQLFHNNDPLKNIKLRPCQPRIIKYETITSKSRTLEDVENGAEQHELLNRIDDTGNRTLQSNSYNTNNLMYMPFCGMLEKIVKNAVQIQHSRRTDVNSQLEQ